MAFYDDEETALQYISMAEGYDGRELIEILRSNLPDGASILELGMGPGVDLNILKKHFLVTGSDLSQFFLDRFLDSYPDSDLVRLDAVELRTDRFFDCIYSNKVLHHLTNGDLVKSIRRQTEILSEDGLVMHSFWRGEGVEEHQGLRFVYQTEDNIRAIFGGSFSTVDTGIYSEMEADDSLYVLARV
jgi:trans-aconitate methyltransferase